jgi:cytoskeletal protein CcmA (bactofilin family)
MFDRNKREANEESVTISTFENSEAEKTAEFRGGVRDAAVIGPSIKINGDLSGEEDLIIQGKVAGTIQLKEKSLTVGKQGKVDANVLAKNIIVDGEVKGDLYGSERVAIRKTGNVHGNIVSPKVSLEEGCSFKGSIDMDQEVINKSFTKSTIASTNSKQDQLLKKSNNNETSKSSNNNKPETDSNTAKSSVAG